MTNRAHLRLLLVLGLALTTACATGGPAPARGTPSSSPHVRCLMDPAERDTRPLVFLFCVESP